MHGGERDPVLQVSHPPRDLLDLPADSRQRLLHLEQVADLAGPLQEVEQALFLALEIPLARPEIDVLLRHFLCADLLLQQRAQGGDAVDHALEPPRRHSDRHRGVDGACLRAQVRVGQVAARIPRDARHLLVRLRHILDPETQRCRPHEHLGAWPGRLDLLEARSRSADRVRTTARGGR